jgi:predicted enzyme related to lactoylglutathione lyase
MSQPVSYVEFNSPDLEATNTFLSDVFGWQFQPFAAGLMPSRDGQPRTIPVIRVPDLDAALERVRTHGGTIAVAPFTIPDVGQGAYILDPTGLLLGLHAYDV